jgi:hypothetical protein
MSNKDPVEALAELQLKHLEHIQSKTPGSVNSYSSGKVYPDSLLQNIDIYRLKALVYRDVVRNDRNKSKPFVIVVSVF